MRREQGVLRGHEILANIYYIKTNMYKGQNAVLKTATERGTTNGCSFGRAEKRKIGRRETTNIRLRPRTCAVRGSEANKIWSSSVEFQCADLRATAARFASGKLCAIPRRSNRRIGLEGQVWGL